MVLAQRLGGLADLPLAWQKDENVAGTEPAELIHGLDDAVVEVALAGLGGFRRGVGRRIGLDRPVSHFHGIQPPADLDHRRRLAVAGEVLGEPLGVDRRGRDDHLQVRPLGQDLAQVADQEVDVEAALVRLVDDDRVVGAQQRVVLGLRQQDAVRHQLDGRAGGHRVVEPHLIADVLAQRRAQFLGNALGRGRGGDPPGLGVADQAAAFLAFPRRATADRQRDLRQLGGLAGASLAGHDDHLAGLQRGGDLFAARGNRQRLGEGDLGQRIGQAHRTRRALRARLTRLARGLGVTRRARRALGPRLAPLLGRLLGPLLGGLARRARLTGWTRRAWRPGNRFDGALC
ncbi:hypothetical protein D3C87_1174590 [compost metagenome]